MAFAVVSDSGAEGRIDGREYPRRRGIIKQGFEPIFDKARLKALGPGLLAQLAFPQRQGTPSPQPLLDDDEADGGKMREAENAAPCPCPAPSPTGQDQRLPADDKEDDQGMGDADDIGQEAIIHRVLPL